MSAWNRPVLLQRVRVGRRSVRAEEIPGGVPAIAMSATIAAPSSTNIERCFGTAGLE